MLDRELIKMKIDILEINASQLSPIAKIPPAKLSLFLSGTRGLNNIEITRLRDAIADLEALVQAAEPFPLSFRNVGVIRDLIAKVKSGELKGVSHEECRRGEKG